MNERDSVGKRIKRFFVLMGSISAITAGVVIAQRLSNDALALLIGLMAGGGGDGSLLATAWISMASTGDAN